MYLILLILILLFISGIILRTTYYYKDSFHIICPGSDLNLIHLKPSPIFLLYYMKAFQYLLQTIPTLLPIIKQSYFQIAMINEFISCFNEKTRINIYIRK